MAIATIFFLVVIAIQVLLYRKFGLTRLYAFGDILVGVLHLLATKHTTTEEHQDLVVVIGQRSQSEVVVTIVCRMEIVGCTLFVKLLSNEV